MSSFRTKRLTAQFAVVLLVVGMSGCLKAPQVHKMIDDANKAAIAATERASADTIAATLNTSAASIAPFPSTAENAQSPAVSDDVTARLSSWIVENQDQPRIVNPLRLRLAYLLVQQGRPASGQVVYDDITDKSTLTSELQQVLYDDWEAFKWWWTAKAQPSFSDNDQRNSSKFHRELVERANEEGRTPYIRSMLHQFAADIRFKQVVRTSNRETIKSLTEEGLQAYGGQFPASQTTTIKALNTGSVPVGEVDGAMVRWYLRVPLTYACFEKFWQRVGIEGADGLTPDWARADPPAECPLSF
jgi:hypothetical protein